MQTYTDKYRMTRLSKITKYFVCTKKICAEAKPVPQACPDAYYINLLVFVEYR